ncbi:hypothetical protein SLS56_002528 [Neofusicoccum ribis]|uniref:FAD dependent oxidoreductase domain-containing protein n=1 Tax=Neofusicoccum ribis TaxID=45134 RepID=A0ABR3T3P8_9PEZI
MVKITILGAGRNKYNVTGMMIASKLPRDYDITILAEHLPGDNHTKEWASPHAAAIWVGVHQSSPREQQMQLDGFAGLWRLAETNPESSARRLEMTEIMDRGAKEDVWYAGKLPEFRFLPAGELPKGSLYGMKYKTSRGVKFLRTRVRALRDLRGLGHDVLINASGFGAEHLTDVREQNINPVRLQVVIAKSDAYDRLFIRRGHNGYYSTAFSRMDGTVYVGGVLVEGSKDLTVSAEDRALICRQAHENQPDCFPSPDPKDWNIVMDHVGVYPTISKHVAGVRCEKETVDGQRVIHAYGQHAGGYVFSYGVACEVERMVDEYLFEIPVVSKL